MPNSESMNVIDSVKWGTRLGRDLVLYQDTWGHSSMEPPPHKAAPTVGERLAVRCEVAGGSFQNVP